MKSKTVNTTVTLTAEAMNACGALKAIAECLNMPIPTTNDSVSMSWTPQDLGRSGKLNVKVN